MFCLKINGTVDKALVSENLKELVGALCNPQPSLFSKPGHSYMVWLVYRQGFMAKYFVGAKKREGGKGGGKERDKTSFSFSSKLDNYVIRENSLGLGNSTYLFCKGIWC